MKCLAGLHNLYQSSPRLRKCTIWAIEVIVEQPLGQAGMVELAGLLNALQMCREFLLESAVWQSDTLEARAYNPQTVNRGGTQACHALTF